MPAPARLLAPAAAIVGILFVVLGAHTTPSGYHAQPSAVPTVHVTIGNGVPPPGPPPPAQGQLPKNAHLGSLPGATLVAIWTLGALLAITFAVIVIRGMTPAGRARRRRRAVSVVPPGPEEQARELVGAVDYGLDELERLPIGEAIIACWQRLAHTATELGIAPTRSDTPAEFVLRVLQLADVRAAPLQRLADLYREARFSAHVMRDVDRDAAREALLAIRSDLMLTAGRGAPV